MLKATSAILIFDFKEAAAIMKDILGTFRLDYEYDIEYEYDFSILVFRLHIIMTHTHYFQPMSYNFYLKPT